MGVLIGQPGVQYTVGQTYSFPQGSFVYQQDGTFEPAGLTSRSVTTIPANTGDPYGASIMPSTSSNSFYSGAMQPPDKGPGGTLTPSLVSPQYNPSDYAQLYKGVEQAYASAGLQVPADVGTYYQAKATTAQPKSSIPAPSPAQSLPSGITKTTSGITGTVPLPAGVVPKSAQAGMDQASMLQAATQPGVADPFGTSTANKDMASLQSILPPDLYGKPSTALPAPPATTAVPGVTQVADNSASDAITRAFGDPATQPNAVKEAGGTAYQSQQDATDSKWKWTPISQTPDGITAPPSVPSGNWRPNSISISTPPVPKPPSNMVTIASGRTVPVGTQGTAQGGRYSYEVQPDGSVFNTVTGRTTSPATAPTVPKAPATPAATAPATPTSTDTPNSLNSYVDLFKDMAKGAGNAELSFDRSPGLLSLLGGLLGNMGGTSGNTSGN